jgi:glycosyltransferase involved in cell wall biosynthesis
MRWSVEVACRAGVAGTTVFSFSDSWHRGGREVVDWDFGLLRRDGSKKPAAETLVKTWREIDAPAVGIARAAEGKGSLSMSVIVCTYRGAEVLADCLRSLMALAYADFEILVVNDGADPEVEKVVAEFSEVRHLAQEHSGLSAARNLGAREAKGEVLVYTDDDCRVDRDWLSYLALAFRSGDFAAAGGPNVAPTPGSLAEACVTAAPGGPAHVLLSDAVAEHVPGCNLAVRREAFEAIGGFREEFWTAGDDVDFCWRLQAAGYRIVFHPAAWVWHLRRRKIRDYLKQQIGYGKAEAMLIPLHPGRFGAISAARWRGWVYDSAFSGDLASSAVIYQGVFGYAGFQGIYGGARGVGYVVSSVQWLLVALAVGLVGIAFPVAAVAAGLMLLLSVVTALRFGWNARLPMEHDGISARLTVSGLALVQPVVRGAVRYFGSLRYARLPRGFPPLNRALVLPKWKLWPARIGLSFWSSEGATRDDLLEHFLDRQRRSGVSLSVGDGWQEWDVEVLDSAWWSEQLTTVTEYHSKEDRLTRARLESRPTLLTVTLRVFAVLAVLACWRSGLDLEGEWLVYAGLATAFAAPSGLRLLRLGRLRSHLIASAHEVGLRRMP